MMHDIALDIKGIFVAFRYNVLLYVLLLHVGLIGR